MCAEASEDATEFIEQNRACQTLLDCVFLDGYCYQGELSRPCGTLSASKSADLGAWQTIADEMEASCECLAEECGAATMCNDLQQCEAVFSSEAFCPSVARDVETFLAANRTCELDSDCMQLASTCYVDDCSVVAVNVDTDPADWAQLDGALWECDPEAGTLCNFVGECGVQHRCSDAGVCETFQ